MSLFWIQTYALSRAIKFKVFIDSHNNAEVFKTLTYQMLQNRARHPNNVKWVAAAQQKVKYNDNGGKKVV